METIVTKAIGKSPKIKVLEFLIESRELDYSISDISKGTGIKRANLFNVWDDFVGLGIVKQTRNISNTKLYKLNTANPFVRKFVDLFDTLVIEPLNKRKKVVVKH